ncbi:hypothetical protein B0H14DRAFT_2581156 [Mycena olivaceomarginata]|nr:hypothetical protein B0H14DRAFT_2581156 [Mycena olivaceomarginata]
MTMWDSDIHPPPIEDDARAIVRRACPWTVKSAFTGKVTEAPFNIETCMEFINTHIRADKKNRLLLRTEMLEEDAQVDGPGPMAGSDISSYDPTPVNGHLFDAWETIIERKCSAILPYAQ